MGSIGMPEIIVIFVVVLMLFGSKRLPELAQALGKGIREFKRATNELKSELDIEPVKRDFEREMSGDIKEIRSGLDDTVASEKTQDKSELKKQGD